MAYPTPTIYTYRVRKISSAQPTATDQAMFLTEFSTNSGTTWLPLVGQAFESLTEAMQEIGKIVGSEALFRTQYLQAPGHKFGNPKVVPVQTIYSYPPA